MVQKMMRATANAMADFIRGGPRVGHRELIIVTKIQNEWRIIQPPQSILEKGEKVKHGALAVLRPALPWVNGMNIIDDQRGRRRFVSHHIEYDVVRIAFCDMMGLPKGITPTMALKEKGFKLIPLAGFHLETDIKRVLKLD